MARELAACVIERHRRRLRRRVCPLVGSVHDIEPLRVELVHEPAERLLFRELVGRYHYLGHAVSFGAHLRYLVLASRPQRVVAGCLQFSSPAWRRAARDRWVGWDDATRARNLQHVVNNSGFLLLPWVGVRNLASAVLSRGLGRLLVDWLRISEEVEHRFREVEHGVRDVERPFPGKWNAGSGVVERSSVA